MIPKRQSYSDREIEEILQSLFAEKKKNKDLELKLNSRTLAPAPQLLDTSSFEQQVTAAKNEAASWKQRYEELAKQTTANPQSKEAQLERVVLFLRNKCDQVDLEKKEMAQKIAQLEQDVTAFQAQNKAPSQELLLERQKLAEVLEEEQALRGQLESLRKIASDADNRYNALKKQHEEQLGASQRELESQRLKITATLQEFKEERRKQEEEYKEKIRVLEQEVAQKDHLRTDDCHALEESSRSLEFIKAQLEAKQKEADDTFRKFQEHLLEHQALIQFTEELKQKLLKADEMRKMAQEALSSKESLAESLNAQVANLARALSDLEESVQHTQSERTEQESRLRVAQQHLAKKVRETTLLAEKNEELRLKTVELEQSLDAARKKQLELQTNLDSEQNHQRKLGEQYQESIRAIEAHAAKWETRYIEIQQRYQEVESRNRELRRLEEKFSKMQQALTQLGAIIGSPLALSTHEPESFISQEISEIQVLPPAAPCATIQPSLFEAAPSPAPRMKETLFG